MGRTLHPCATTTEAVRRKIRNSRESATALAERYGINRKTVQKWRKRNDVKDGWRGRSKERSSTVLSKEEEAIITGFRRISLLPLDDCLYALQDRIPRLTRSSLHRCLQRYDLNRLPRNPRARQPKAAPAAYSLGHFHIDVGETRTEEGSLRVFAATDLASRLFFAAQYDRADRRAAGKFLQELIDAIPYRIRTILTADVAPFTSPSRKRSASRTAAKPAGIFDALCARFDIEHTLTRPDRAWANLQMRRIADLPGEGGLSHFAYESHQHLESYMRGFMYDYNFGKRLKILQGRTPYQFVCKMWAAYPEQFTRNPLHLPLGTRIAREPDAMNAPRF